jgi:5-methylcytosine-specific restriction endonuclease McrA
MRGGQRDPAPEAAPVLDAAAREKLVRQAAGKSTREVQQMLAEVDPELAQPSDRMRVLGQGRWELKAAVDAECRHGLEKLQMLLSHQDPHLTLGGLVARLVRDGLDRYDPARPRRTRRSGTRGSVDGQRSATPPAQRDIEAVQRNAARAKSGSPARRREVEQDAGSPATVRDGGPRPSAPTRHSEAKQDGAKSTEVRDMIVRTNSAARRHAVAEHNDSSPAAVPNNGGCAASAAKRILEAERGNASPAAVPIGGGPTDSAAKCQPSAEIGRRSGAEAGDGGQGAALAKRQVRSAGVGQGAAGPHSVAGTGCASWVPVQGHRFSTSAAKRLASGSRDGAVPQAKRSPALERHLATLSCLDSLPGARSRYIPAAVRRAVWRRDQGCCCFVDRHSGQRCRSRYRLEIDHVVPFALGGANELINLRLHCRAHHRLRHAQHHAVPAKEPTEATDVSDSSVHSAPWGRRAQRARLAKRGRPAGSRESVQQAGA